MRVIAGQARGVPLVAPTGRQTRPTADRLKGAMFAVLGDACAGRVLDLFAGSGALGIEALSRGASACDFVDSAAAACVAIERNLAKTRLSGEATVHRLSVERFVERGRSTLPLPAAYDVILADPPYEFATLEALLRQIAGSPLVGDQTIVLVEHASRHPLPLQVGCLDLIKTRRHGDGAFSIYTRPRHQRRL